MSNQEISDDVRQEWRKFSNKAAFDAAILHFRMNAPRVNGRTPEKMMKEALELQGWMKAWDALEELVADEPKVAREKPDTLETP